MATITADAYNDAAARTAGEVMTINSGAKWTIRTDTRTHANAPASNTGSLGSVTVNEGEVIWDSRNIRWMPYNSGTGNVPAVGTTISRNGVSGYLLGVWASLTSAKTAVGAAMPATGFLKFREITNGPFSAGALTGIGASAVSPDVQGWMSIAQDAASNLTFPRLGKHTARGGRFYLDDTTGVRGQTFQVPTEGSAAMFAPGLFIETGVGTDEYEFWPALNGSTNGWSHLHVGNATGTTDRRQSALLAAAGGTMKMGETWSASATYASLAAQAGTYAGIGYTGVYTWQNDIVEVYVSSGHYLETGQQTGLDFTSGGASDGIYTVTVLDAYRFTIPLTGSGAGGAVSVRPGISVTFTAHTLNVGDSVYCDFTSGSGVDGTYEVYAVPSANTYSLKYPSVAAITSGNVSCLHTLVITSNAHGLSVGQTIYCDFTTGTGVNGVYPARVVATNTISISMPHSATTSGNVTISRDVGFVAPAGRKTWIPSNILNECTTAARATNTAPNATIASRPEWTTTSAGAIDLEYVYGCSGYLNLSQPYSMRLRNCVFFDQSVITECATALDIDGLYAGMHGALDSATLSLANNYAGGTVKNVKGFRGNTPGSTDHAISIAYCFGQTFENVEGAIVQYARSTGYPIQVTTCNGLSFAGCRVLNGRLNITNSPNITITNLDYNERVNGLGLAAMGAVSVDAGCHNLKVDGITCGYGGTIPNQYPLFYLYSIGCQNVKLRNIGSRSAKIPAPTQWKNLLTTQYLYQSAGSNNGVKVQKCFVEAVKTGPYTTINSDKDMTYESVFGGMYAWSTKALLQVPHSDLNGVVKGVQLINTTADQASVYGTHFEDMFTGDYYGRFLLACNEPSTETASQFENVVGTAKFNSKGGVIVQNVYDQCIFTDNVFRLGHTGFNRSEVVMSGGTLSNYLFEYQIDTGSGFSGWKNLCRQKAGCSGTSGQYTFNIPDITGISVGDYCFGTGLSTVGLGCKDAAIPRITEINGNTVTVDVANASTFGVSTLRFTQLPSEVIDPAVGFKMKLRITTVATATAAITYIRVETLSTPAAQENQYPLDTASVQVDGLVSGSRVKAVKVSDGTVIANVAESGGMATFETEYIGALRIVARKGTGSPTYKQWETQLSTVSGQTVTATALQELDE